MTVKTIIQSIQRQPRGTTTIYTARFSIVSDPANVAPVGQEGLASITLPIDEATAQGLKVGQAFTVTFA